MPVTQADRGSGAPPNCRADRPSQMRPSGSPGHLPPGSDDRSACRTRWLVILRMSSASPVPGDADDPLLGKCFACSGQRAKVRIAPPRRDRLRPPWRKGEGMSSVLADSSYPLLNVFWTMFEFFLWIIWIWILIWIFIDIFRSHDLSGWAKALWFLFVLFIPLIGVLVYLIARGSSMQERAQQDQRRQDQQFRQYVQEAAASAPASTADQLTKLADLRDRGVISAEEFEREKAKVLAAGSSTGSSTGG